MKSNTFKTLATAAVVVLLCGGAGADILNGDFSTGDTTDWQVQDSALGTGSASHEIVDYSGNTKTFHGEAEITYQWDGSQWVLPTSGFDFATITLIQPQSGVTLDAPNGTTTLSFTAATIYKVDDVGDDADGQVSVTLAWEKKTDPSDNDVNFVQINDDAFKNYQVDITDQNVIDNIDQYKFTVTALVNCVRNGDEPGGENQGDEMKIEIDAYFDDFEFVPEPATVLLLSGGGLITLLRKRRT